MFQVMGEDRTLPVALAMWLPNLIFIVLALSIFHRVEQERPLIPEFFSSMGNQLLELFFLNPWKKLTRPWQQKRKAIRRRHTGLLVHADPDSGLFHLPGCRQYQQRKSSLEFRDIQLARKAGFRPCPVCQAAVQQQEQHEVH